MSLLIAEIGNCHLGNMKLAKELIRIAHESGADLIKGQAFRADDIKTGSMAPDFYRNCALSEGQYLELLYYARDLKTDMFYSIFSTGFDRIKQEQNWIKFAASQTLAGGFTWAQDNNSTVVSFPRTMIEQRRVPKVRKAWPLYATEYMPKDVNLHALEFLKDQAQTDIGLSDHSLGVETCLRAIKWYGAICIEKHFTLQKEMKWGGQVFRDTVHGATPKELEVIASAMHRGK